MEESGPIGSCKRDFKAAVAWGLTERDAARFIVRSCIPHLKKTEQEVARGL